MKTRINILKTSIFISIFLTSLLINSETLAQKSFNSFEAKKISENLVRSSADIIAEIASSFRTDVYYEEQISLEEWMIDLNKFAGKYVSESDTKSVEPNDFSEPKMEMDDWMMESDWNYLKHDNFKEDVLKLEKWMCCPRNWNI